MSNQMFPSLPDLIMSHLRDTGAELVPDSPSFDSHFRALARWLAAAGPILAPASTTTASWVNTPTPGGEGVPAGNRAK